MALKFRSRPKTCPRKSGRHKRQNSLPILCPLLLKTLQAGHNRQGIFPMQVHELKGTQFQKGIATDFITRRSGVRSRPQPPTIPKSSQFDRAGFQESGGASAPLERARCAAPGGRGERARPTPETAT
jgi:hypothetical protein